MRWRMSAPPRSPHSSSPTTRRPKRGTAMADNLTLIQGTRLRATRVDSCGAPVGGSDAYTVTDGFISVAMKDNVDTGDEFKTKKASGEYCVNQRSKPELNWIELTITL